MRQARIEWIESLGIPTEERGTSMLSIKVKGRRIDFWPASDTYYLHAKGEFGVGIQTLVEKIKKHLEGKKDETRESET